METSGWITLIIAWSTIGSLAAYTLWRTIRTPPQDLSAPLELEAEHEEQEAAREAAEEEEAR